MTIKALKLAFVATSAILVLSGTALSMGDSQPANKPDVVKKFKPVCKKHWAIKTVSRRGNKVQRCVKLVAGLVSDDELYDQGRELAKNGYYEDALEILTTIADQEQPRVLNYIGYSHRKAGRLETGISFYQRALAINPDFVLAREYLGEGYAAAGFIELANVQLDEIKTRCGVNCREYQLLKEAITAAS